MLSGEGFCGEEDGEKTDGRFLLEKLFIYEMGENRRKMAKL